MYIIHEALRLEHADWVFACPCSLLPHAVYTCIYINVVLLNIEIMVTHEHLSSVTA